MIDSRCSLRDTVGLPAAGRKNEYGLPDAGIISPTVSILDRAVNVKWPHHDAEALAHAFARAWPYSPFRGEGGAHTASAGG
jgi:hypothetical protein